MKPVVSRPSAAAVSMLRQATKLFPKRSKASDGLLPSAQHVLQNPNSDHNSGLAVDLTHDPVRGVDCKEIFNELKKDRRVSYLIHNNKIWSPEKGERRYRGANPHKKHIHVSIKKEFARDTSNWFPWVDRKPTVVGTLKAAVQPAKKKTKSS